MKLVHSGVIPTEIEHKTKQQLLRNKESTLGKSETYPQMIRANVFVMPITEMSKDA